VLTSQHILDLYQMPAPAPVVISLNEEGLHFNVSTAGLQKCPHCCWQDLSESTAKQKATKIAIAARQALFLYARAHANQDRRFASGTTFELLCMQMSYFNPSDPSKKAMCTFFFARKRDRDQPRHNMFSVQTNDLTNTVEMIIEKSLALCPRLPY